MSRDVFGCHNWGTETGQDPAQHPTMHRTAPTTKNLPGQSVSSAKIEKPCPNVNTVHGHGSCVKTKKPTWVHSY